MGITLTTKRSTHTNARFFEEELCELGEEVALSAANARVARSVLRLSRGDRVHLLNGRGGIAKAELLDVGKSRVTAAIFEKKEASPAWPEITLLQGLPKGEKSNWVIQKGVELGVSRILFFESARTIGKKGSNQVSRWKRVAVEALRQSGNPYLPIIEGPLPLKEILEKVGKSKQRICLDESEKMRRLRDCVGAQTPPSFCVAVGPEGGWSEEDREGLRIKGFQTVQVAPFTLRTETAAISVLAALRAWFP